jgi:hypothetical protein
MTPYVGDQPYAVEQIQRDVMDTSHTGHGRKKILFPQDAQAHTGEHCGIVINFRPTGKYPVLVEALTCARVYLSSNINEY